MAAAALDFTTGFSDPEVNDVELDFAGLTSNQSNAVLARVSKGSGFITGPSYSNGNTNTYANSMAVTGTTTAGGPVFSGTIKIRNPRSTTASLQGIEFNSMLGSGRFFEAGTAAAIDGFRLFMTNGNISAGCLVRQWIYRT